MWLCICCVQKCEKSILLKCVKKIVCEKDTSLKYTWSMKEKNTKNYSTECSHVVPHHSTDSAISSLTLEIGRDPVLSAMYGRS